MSIRSKINSSLNNLTLSSSFKNLDLNGGNEVLKYSAEEIASQLTLIDVTAFKSIRREELSSLSWNTSRKMQMTPNLVSFTRLFNKVSFWVIEEILFADRKVRTCIDGTAKQRNIDIDGPKCRGEVITHFIRIAKRLFDLNNIHSCYAVISALSSSSIYRLSKSWNFVGKKDKAIFDKLSLLLTDENNFEALRMHLSAVKSDCIPYLGMYLRDLVYTDIAHPVSPGLQNTQRTIKLDKIINTVIGFQESTTYDFLTPIAHIKKYLNSVNYIEELQKFLEEDNFKLSQKLEPPEPKPDHDKFNSQSVFYVKDSFSKRPSNSDSGIFNTLPVSPVHIKCCGKTVECKTVCSSHYFETLSRSATAKTEKPFVHTHRKTKSLGTSIVLEDEAPTKDVETHLKGRYLIDDSKIENDQIIDANGIHIIYPVKKGTDNFAFRITDEEEYTDVSDDEEDCDMMKPLADKAFEEDSYGESLPIIAYEGYVKRKTILKDGKKPALSAWVRYWLVLRGSTLLYYPSKSFRGCCRGDFRTSPTKCIVLKNGWVAVKVEDDPQLVDCFTLSGPNGKNVYKFKTNTHLEATSWCREINDASNGCLINL